MILPLLLTIPICINYSFWGCHTPVVPGRRVGEWGSAAVRSNRFLLTLFCFKYHHLACLLCFWCLIILTWRMLYRHRVEIYYLLSGQRKIVCKDASCPSAKCIYVLYKIMFFPVTSVTCLACPYKSAFKMKQRQSSCGIEEAADQTENTSAHCSHFYLLSTMPCLLLWLEISWSCMSVCRAAGVEYAGLSGSQEWCDEVTTFMFRHTLQGTPIFFCPG